MLQLMRTTFRAIANSDSYGHRIGEWVFLLDGADPLPIRRGGFHLGDPRGPGFARPQESIYLAIAALSTACGPVWLAFCVDASGDRRWNFRRISSALLAFGLSREGYHRLLIFLAYPYWAGILTAQWPPLIMASAFFPFLLPATLAKPQIGLPVVLTHLSRRGVLACIAVLLLSLAIMPRWPMLWMANAGHYERFIPLLVFPGWLLALALLRYSDRDALLLLLMAIMPQRWFYDTLILWLIPKTRRAIVWTVFFSWVPGIWRWYHIPHSYVQVGRWTVCFIYLPMLVVVLSRFLTSRHIREAN